MYFSEANIQGMFKVTRIFYHTKLESDISGNDDCAR